MISCRVMWMVSEERKSHLNATPATMERVYFCSFYSLLPFLHPRTNYTFALLHFAMNGSIYFSRVEAMVTSKINNQEKYLKSHFHARKKRWQWMVMMMCLPSFFLFPSSCVLWKKAKMGLSEMMITVEKDNYHIHIFLSFTALLFWSFNLCNLDNGTWKLRHCLVTERKLWLLKTCGKKDVSGRSKILRNLRWCFRKDLWVECWRFCVFVDEENFEKFKT